MKTFILMHVALAFFVVQSIFRVGGPRKLMLTPLIVDYVITTCNIFLLAVISAVVVVGMKHMLDASLPFLSTGLLDDRPMWFQGAVTFLAIDFTAYASHRLRHRVECLWFFHAIHHSQRVMNPLANLRFHPFDLVFDTMLRAAPMLVLGGSETGWFWFSMIDYLWGYFVHADIRINCGPVKYVVVTPQYHRIHHSVERRHANKNFGDRLVVWDYLFGTMYMGFDEYPATGVVDYPVQENSVRPRELVRTWWGHTVYPFCMIYQSLRGSSPQVAPAPGPATPA